MKRCAIVIVVLLSVQLADAEWIQNGKAVPDNEWRKSSGDFGAMLEFTDDPDAFFAAWSKPDPAVLTDVTSTAQRNKPIVVVVAFSGCKPDAAGTGIEGIPEGIS